MREPILPASPRGQGVEVVESVSRGEPLQADRGERRGRLAESEAGVALAIQELYPVPLDREDAGEDGAGEAGADDCDLHHRSWQPQATLGSARPVRFMRCRR